MDSLTNVPVGAARRGTQPTPAHRDCPACDACAREDWEEERHAFTLQGREYDLPEPFACGWCGTQVGSNGTQAFAGGGITFRGEPMPLVTSEWPYIFIDPAGTAWHTLCAFEKE